MHVMCKKSQTIQQKIHIIAREMVGSMFTIEKNSRSKDEAYENRHSNTIHSTLKARLLFVDSSVSKESTSYMLYNRLKFFPDILKWYDDTLPSFIFFRPNINFLEFLNE